ncbi:MAG: hypothetical protein ABI867_05345 [Kofleriaceae bacterium]
MKALAALVVWTGVAHAQPVAVKVTELVGDATYIEPGEEAGLRIGTRVTIDHATFVVVAVNAKTAAIGTQTGQLETTFVGATGTAEIVARPLPQPASAYREQWPPYPSRTAERVAAGTVERDPAPPATRVTVIGSGFIAANASETRGSGEARVIAAWDRDRLGLDVDAAWRGYSAGWNREEREPVFVRAAQLRYGRVLAVGRLRYAASMLGMLDGARVATTADDFEIAAFGGLVPDALSSEPDVHATRFGTEAVWDGKRAPWQPRVALAIHGSTFEGKLDERRAVIAGSASEGRTWVDAWAEAQQFPGGNPFGAKAVELVGAGASIAWRGRVLRAGLGATFLRPERSLRLASVLPPEWQCSLDAAGQCAGGDYWMQTTATVGVRGEVWSVDAIFTLGQTRGLSIGSQADPVALGTVGDRSVYLRSEYRGSSRVRYFVAPAAGHTAFADWFGVETGVGFTLPKVDLSIAYRPERLDDGPEDRTTLHSAIVEVHASASSTIDLGAQVLGTLGDDRNALAALASVIWRVR